MDLQDNRYWPFETLPPVNQTPQQKQEMQFLEDAYRDGYHPYMFGSENFGATCESRGGFILYRGRQGRHWEVLLGTSNETLLSAHVNNFGSAAEMVFRWLRGGQTLEIVEYSREFLIISPATGEGYILHD